MKVNKEKLKEYWKRIKDKKRWIYCVLIVFICLITMAVIGNRTRIVDENISDTDSIKEDDIKEEDIEIFGEESDEIEEAPNIDNVDEWYDDYKVVYYGDTRIMRYEDKYIGPGNANYQIAQYFWMNLSKYTDVYDDFNSAECTIANRTKNIFYLKTYNSKEYFAFIEVEQNNEDNKIYYVKITNSINNDVKYYKVSLIENGTTVVEDEEYMHYDIDVKNTNYEEIDAYVSSFTEDPSPLTDNRT